MSDRSPTARDRPSLARVHRPLQCLTYAASGLFIVLFILSPDFAHSVLATGRLVVASILH